MRLQSAARARSVDGTVARGKMADAKNRCETRNVRVSRHRSTAVYDKSHRNLTFITDTGLDMHCPLKATM